MKRTASNRVTIGLLVTVCLGILAILSKIYSAHADNDSVQDKAISRIGAQIESIHPQLERIEDKLDMVLYTKP